MRDVNGNAQVQGGNSIIYQIDDTTSSTNSTYSSSKIDELIGSPGPGDITTITKYSFNYNYDVQPFYNDGFVSFGWDAPGNDIECYMITPPVDNTGLRSSCFLHGTIKYTQISITEQNYMYDLYSPGINSGEIAEIWVSAYSDATYPVYKLIAHHTGININVIVERIYIYIPIKLRYPRTPLTDGSRVTSSPSMSGDGFQPYRAFDDIYGENAIGVYANSQQGGFFSISSDTTSSLIVNGINTIGRYFYLDLQPDSTMAVITSFQIYSMRERFPIEYHLIGSNDQSDWMSLYHTTSAVIAGNIPHGEYNTGYTHEINLTSNYTYFRYVGLIVQSQETLIAFPAAHTSIQELLLYSTR
jgi:hypothetical protein